MRLLNFLPEEAIVLDIQPGTKEDAIRELIAVVVKQGDVTAANQAAITEAVFDREKKGSTGLGEGIAIPHVKDSPYINGLAGAFARLKRPIPFNAIDGNPVDLIFLILGGAGTSSEHVQILRTLASLRQNEHFLRFLRQAKDVPTVADLIREMAGVA